jgi:hypothetical protein
VIQLVQKNGKKTLRLTEKDRGKLSPIFYQCAESHKSFLFYFNKKLNNNRVKYFLTEVESEDNGKDRRQDQPLYALPLL